MAADRVCSSLLAAILGVLLQETAETHPSVKLPRPTGAGKAMQGGRDEMGQGWGRNRSGEAAGKE